MSEKPDASVLDGEPEWVRGGDRSLSDVDIAARRWGMRDKAPFWIMTVAWAFAVAAFCMLSASMPSGCAAGNLSPEIKAEADIRADLKAELDLALSKQSSSSSTATGNNSNVINLQLAGGGGVLSMITMALGAWLGRRTPLKALGRTVSGIESEDKTGNVKRRIFLLGKANKGNKLDAAQKLIEKCVQKRARINGKWDEVLANCPPPPAAKEEGKA